MANGTNYTLYYNVLNYLKTIMKNHPSINFVSQGDAFSIDTKEFPQYPLGNVIITTATFDDKSTDYGIQIVVADKTKLKDNESSGSNNQQTISFEGTDDTVDIHANTLSIINDILSYTDRKEEGFEIQGTTNCTAFKERFDNGLAGWSADFTLRVHNDRNICLFDLNPSDNITALKVENCSTSDSFYVTLRDDVPVGSGSFWSNEIEGTYQSYNISGSVSIDERDLEFENIDIVSLENYEGDTIISQSWFTDCTDADENYTIDLTSVGTPGEITYIDDSGLFASASGITISVCGKGVITKSGNATYDTNRTTC